MEIVTCPSTSQIVQLLRGQVEGPLAAQLTLHVESCSRCIRALQMLGDDSSKEGQAIASAPASPQGLTDQSVLSSEEPASQLAFLAPPLGPDEIGWLAHYRVLKVLGEGGMGIVLLAEDTQLERQVALKVIKAEYSQDAEVQQRFLREARAMAQVKSDHVITIHHVGQHNNVGYIAMELLEGGSLDSFLGREPGIPLTETLRIGREIAQALVAAHARGLIHRDIKPENVWIEAPSGRVKLLDFGLARPQKVNVKLTSTGIIIGTPAYMSPEQARAENIDGRSDLFSLGCLLYELIAGRPPFFGETVMAILLALAGETPLPPSHYNIESPAALDDLILKLLAKQPADRPQSADQVIKQLEAIEGTLPRSILFGRDAGVRPSASTTGPMPTGLSQLGMTGSSPETSSSRRRRAREAERRQVTMLVCNCQLFESDDYLERLDVEDQAALVRAFQESCKQAILKLEGTVVQSNEESVLACFGYPVAHEDAGRRAAITALDVLENLTVLAEQVRQEHKVELSPWIGIHTGPAIVETKGDDVSLVGEARNVVIRLKESAAPGQIICSEATHRVLRGRFNCSSLGLHKVKGLEHPIELFRVEALVEESGPITAAEPVELTPLTGRDQEMSLLKDRWEQAQEGMGQVVLLIGEAGLGKSRLVHAMKQHVRGNVEEARTAAFRMPTPANGVHDPPIVEWYCSPHFRNTGLYPASHFFERFLDFRRDKTPAERFDRLVQHLKKYDLASPEVVPLFASLLSLPPDARYPSLMLPPVREREEMFRALKQWLSAYSSRQPVLFVVEDLHWLDASTLEFLGQFLEEGLHDRILTILTFRPEFRTPWPALPHQTSLALNRLTKRQVGDLMRKKTGHDLPDAVVDKVFDRSSGVPLFVEEFTKIVEEAGTPEQGGRGDRRIKTLMTHEIPATLQDLIMARLDRMEGDRELAQLAATLGREFSYEMLEAVAAVAQSTLEVELAKLIHAEILFQKGRPPHSTYLFKHALLEDALYNSLIKGKRQQFHGRIAEVLETRFPQTVKTKPELLAHHFTEAGLIEKSIGYWLAAGLNAQEQFANLEAVSHLTRGLELLKTLPESPERDINELLLLNPLGSAYQANRGYAAPEVGPTFERARELCQKTGQTSQLFEVMWGNWTWHLVRGDLRLCMDLAAEMMALGQESQDRGMIMEAYVAPAVTLFYRGEFAGCQKHCEEAIANYEDLEQCRIWSLKLGQNAAVVLRCYLSLALWHLGYPDQAVRTNEEMLALARQIGHPFSLCHGLHFTGWLYQNCRLGDKLRAAGEEEIAIAVEQGFALWESTGTFFKGAGMLLQGDLEGALPLLEKGPQSFKAIAAALTLPGQFGVLANAYIKAGKLEQAREVLDEGLALAEEHDDRAAEVELHRLKGELLLLNPGDQSAGEACFHKAIERARAQQSRGRELRATISLASLWQKQGRRQEAQSVLATVYSAFTEGFTMPDLVEANELLKSLG
jgi:serine/threonine protein kinase/predicted ATPase